MPWREVPAFYQSIPHNKAGLALRMVILTAARVAMVQGLAWSDIDLAGKVWTVPAGRMKAKRSLAIPLTPASLAILESIPRDTAHPFRMDRQTIAARAPGTTIHGFRSSFADWVAETHPDDQDACEVQLAHTVGSAVTRAYRRTDLLDRRRSLMQAWSDFLSSPAA